jgi:hypothetical protein
MLLRHHTIPNTLLLFDSTQDQTNTKPESLMHPLPKEGCVQLRIGMASHQNVANLVHCIIREVNVIRLNRASHGVVGIRRCTAYINKHDLRQAEEIVEAQDEGEKLPALVPAPNNFQVIEHQIHGLALGTEASKGIAEGGDKIRWLVGDALARGGGGRRRRAELGE